MCSLASFNGMLADSGQLPSLLRVQVLESLQDSFCWAGFCPQGVLPCCLSEAQEVSLQWGRSISSANTAAFQVLARTFSCLEISLAKQISPLPLTSTSLGFCFVFRTWAGWSQILGSACALLFIQFRSPRPRELLSPGRSSHFS